MNKIFAPWRVEYVKKAKDEDYNECIFCEKPQENKDKENLLLLRGDKSFIILNKYPYNPGHGMVSTYRHIADYTKLSTEEVTEIHKLISNYIGAVEKVFNPDGFNIGMNIGKTGGAGIEDHLHIHIVPRWEGDNNFMPVLSDTRIISQSIESSYEELINEI